ncbi:MAG TPA: flagellar hook-associated protein FlgK [Pirellulales bacterium]|jgi:flagellar hook-associated protein 1 FlgK|nr:flagellar hook-associated protein FlgK [Pirellulales bacterium]
MSLFSSIQMASNTLQIQQIGLQVAGQNISNASTPGYSREVVDLAAGPSQQVGGLLLGTGVQIHAIQQEVDQFLNQRVRGAASDQTSTALSTQTYQQLESLFGELNSSNLGTSLTDFTSSIAQVLNSPQDVPTRNLAVLKGQTVASTLNNLASQASQLRSHLNDQVIQDAGNINSLLNQVGKLNVQIADAEGGNTTSSQAVGLRDQRDQALSDLSKLINITTTVQPDGTVNVYSGGDYLISEGQVRQVKVDTTSDRGLSAANIRLAATDSKLAINSGEVGGLINSRDQILGGFLDQLDSFAGTLAHEFNKIYSTGQGLNGYSQVTSTTPVDDVNTALDATGLKNSPSSGTFQVLVYNKATGLTQTTNVQVTENGLAGDTSLSNLASQLNSISGLSAATTPEGKLTISTTSADQQVAFAGDTSGTLAALGINTFFTGSDARGIAVNSAVVQDPSTFAASSGGVGVDTNVAQQLAQFQDLPLASQNGATMSNLYDQIASSVTQGSSVAKSVSDSAATFAASLEGQQQSISGVNIDEETVNMLQYQRNFQASAKYIATLSQLLNDLVQL